MNIQINQTYQLKGERNNAPRQPLMVDGKLFLIFVYDKKGFTESRIQCLTESLDLVWEYKYPHVINNLILTCNNNLLASCMDGQVISFNTENGNQLWVFNNTDSNIGALSNESAGRVVFAGVQGRAASTWCLNTNDGSLAWKQSYKGHSYTPKIHNNLVYNCIGNNIYCLSLIDGSLVWMQAEPETYLFNPKIFKEFVVATGHGLVNFYNFKTGQLTGLLETKVTGLESYIREIIADDGNIYFGDASGCFYCYMCSNLGDVLDVKIKWKLETGGAISSIPAIQGDEIFLINDDCKFISVDKNTGKPKFEMKIKGKANISGITINNSHLYFSCHGGHVYICKLPLI